MIYLFAGMILLAAFPMILTIWRMRSAASIKKKGIYTNGVVTHISTLRTRPGSTIDILTFEYKDRATGQPYNGRATVTHGQFQLGATMEVVYLPNKPSKYAIDTKKGYWFILIFCIILFLFIIFAVYKLDGMMRTGSA